MERLARADILVKDLYVENAHLIAAVQRLEQHCQMLAQMTSDCSSVWIWLCHFQVCMDQNGWKCYKVRGFMCSGLWCYVVEWVLSKILKDFRAFIFGVKGLHNPEDEVIIILQNIGNFLPSDAALHARRLESSAAAALEGPQISHYYEVFWKESRDLQNKPKGRFQ